MNKLFQSMILGSALLATQIGWSANDSAKPAAAKSSTWVRPYGMAGCGLGSMIVGRKGGQIFAATTNGTVNNQIFGITFGTSNCVDNPNLDVASRMDRFVAANKVAIAGDMARGSGETLNNLSQLMGCDQESAQVGAVMQQHFREIFPDAQVQPNEVTDSIISTVMDDASLSKVCKNIT